MSIGGFGAGGNGIVTDGLIFSIDAYNNKSYVSGNTTIYDLNKNSNDGTLTNGVTHDGTSLNFDGTNQWIDFLDQNIAAVDYGDPFSLDFWIKRPAITTQDIVVSRQRNSTPQIGWRVVFPSGNGKLNFGMIDGSTSNDGLKKQTTLEYNDNTWRHFICTYNGATAASGLTIYVDGIVEDEIALDNYGGGGASFLATVGSPRMVIGSRYDSLYAPPEMSLSSLRIYNKELSSTEAKQNYDALKYRFI
jgi:hypothetical protein